MYAVTLQTTTLMLKEKLPASSPYGLSPDFTHLWVELHMSSLMNVAINNEYLQIMPPLRI
jgi:hypothetical protein